MATFEQFLESLDKDIIEYAEHSWSALRQAATADARAFVQKSRQDLERWSRLLALGELSRDDFDWLVRSKRDLAELMSLKQKGLAKVALDQFVNGLIALIVSAAFKVFL
ncbi:hypothetical protein [Bordetella pseudohinzii]|uniref:Uncharacterized protein n=1 Tax=Bordetella pseudohinzii TaxID=1331258 RepID=A0A0J6CDN9_9BORD|nr:hypothetical protein [Bordetella pseudohinzii]ANY16597.1 hypothetical protein BBN53_12245 [Bordetella pseudohinzii]KMM27752.1 hypothetical protein L540_01765 [Bordetella pseudohinzii]KXA81901.1 hypothetical protein AW877_03240 [Bordetella pseudohinzii]KXA82202.1 hypothetical protein AW878_02860 [Bordetella pseudohinzii]CUI31543.1 Uncharacterised protein [Bordetella pseudohinzii]